MKNIKIPTNKILEIRHPTEWKWRTSKRLWHSHFKDSHNHTKQQTYDFKHMTSKGTQWPLYALKRTGRKEFEKKKSVWYISGLANNKVEVEETSRPAYFEELSEGRSNYIR